MPRTSWRAPKPTAPPWATIFAFFGERTFFHWFLFAGKLGNLGLNLDSRGVQRRGAAVSVDGVRVGDGIIRLVDDGQRHEVVVDTIAQEAVLGLYGAPCGIVVRAE